MTEQATAQAAPQQQARELTPYERFRNYVQTTDFIAQVAALVGGEAQAKTFIRVTLTAVQQTPDLLTADRRTLLLACMKAARDKLMPDGKEAVFNIYNTKVKVDEGGRSVERWIPAVQYLPMVAGLVKKLYDSGHVTFVDSAAVYEKDGLEYERGDNPRLVHKPYLGDDAGQIVAAYVVVKLKNGEIKREVMARRDIEKVRAASKAPDGPGWSKWYDQFAIKSVIKRAYKQLPSSVELEQVIANDNDAIGFSDFASAGDEFVGKQPAAIESINKAIEHKPLEPLPGVVGAKQADAVHADAVAQATGAVAQAAAETKAAERDTKSTKRETKAAKAETTKAAPPAPTWQEVVAAIDAAAEAKDEDRLALAGDLARGLTNSDERASAVAHYDQVVAGLKGANE